MDCCNWWSWVSVRLSFCLSLRFCLEWRRLRPKERCIRSVRVLNSTTDLMQPSPYYLLLVTILAANCKLETSRVVGARTFGKDRHWCLLIIWRKMAALVWHWSCSVLMSLMMQFLHFTLKSENYKKKKLSILRLHWMHKMQTIVTDDPGACLSVTRLNWASLCKNRWTDQDGVWGEHSWGPKEHCVQWGEGNSMQPLPNYSGLLFFIQIFVFVYTSFVLYLSQTGARP